MLTTTKKKVETFIHPAGFIEQHYTGLQTLNSVLAGLKELENHVKEVVREQGKPALILVDTTGLAKVDLSRRMLKARKTGTRLMRQLHFERAAIYGPLAVQILVNTMARVGGVHKRIRVFDQRAKALKWLQSRE
ncbi:STAS/SEC14 domain-containing protein [Candidatus Saccharibacteria bacterium]|nr:STAS/SEC14 domain-containing protein [Candidatus Saccharibacteria bacterium]